MTKRHGARNVGRDLRRSALTVALGLCLASTAQAQSTAGVVFGQTRPGDTVVVENPNTGFRREITADASGAYRVPALPAGAYTVTATRSDGTTETRTVAVNAGTGTAVNFGAQATAGATTLEAIQVTGGRINTIDPLSFSNSTVLTSEQLEKIPVPRDITSAALLAPGANRGDAAFGNLASFGGASVAENQYYVNGFNVTNSFRGLEFGSVPFEAIAEQQILTGGYGAEFGRSLGGVVNITTKSGTNDFHAGGVVYYSPESLRDNPPNSYRNDGAIRSDNSNDNLWNGYASAWASGPLVRDKLFGFALVQYEKEEETAYGSYVSSTNSDFSDETPAWLVKLDWNINDYNRLEFTAFSDETEGEEDVYRSQGEAQAERGDYLGTVHTETGGENYVGKYTGYFTDNFTVSALYGTSTFKRNLYGVTANGIRQEYDGQIGFSEGCPIIVDQRLDVSDGLITGCDFIGTLDRADGEDTRDQYRIDAEWALGDHLVRFGYDVDEYESIAGSSYEGGARYAYQNYTMADGTRGTRVEQRIFQNGSTVEVNQHAYYIEDTWSITNNFNAYVGLRWDNFENKNGAGEVYVEQKDQFTPRLGFSWDVNGDNTFKVYGNAGRYALPLTSSVAIRGASASLYSRQFFSYTGIDPVTGAPLGTTPLTDIQYLNNEYGESKNPDTVASTNLDPQYQDEYILGFEKALNDNLTFGIRATYRELKAAIDDTCDYRPFVEYAEENGLEFNPLNPNFPYCRMFNPGEDLVTIADVNGDGTLETITIDGEVLAPQAKRNYQALEFSLRGQWEGLFLQAPMSGRRATATPRAA